MRVLLLKLLLLAVVCTIDLPTGSSFYVDNKVYTDAGTCAWSTTTPESQNITTAALNSAYKALAKDRAFRALLVARNGNLVYERYGNGGTAQQARNIHSASKSILSMAVGQRLPLDATVGQLLGTKFSVPSNKRSITVKHLLTMTSGISWSEDVTEYRLGKNPIQGILNLGQAATPGTRFNYSTGDATLLHAMLTESGGSLTEITNPLGITVEAWGIDALGYRSGGCNFFITPREMLRFGQYALEQRKANDPWMIAATTGSRGYGYMWWTDIGSGNFRAWGWGRQFIYVWPNKNLVCVTVYDTAGSVNDGDNYSTISRYVVGAAK